MLDSLTNFMDDFKKWNKFVYDHINTRKKNLIHKLSTIQEQMDISENNF